MNKSNRLDYCDFDGSNQLLMEKPCPEEDGTRDLDCFTSHRQLNTLGTLRLGNSTSCPWKRGSRHKMCSNSSDSLPSLGAVSSAQVRRSGHSLHGLGILGICFKPPPTGAAPVRLNSLRNRLGTLKPRGTEEVTRQFYTVMIGQEDQIHHASFM